MGSSPSKPAFPVPRPYDDSSKSGKWSFSMKSLSKKGKDRSEKYDDFIIPKLPAPATAPGMYGFPYYQQVPSAYPSTYPAYYAPVQMAIMQPIGMQQPVLAMPPTYLPIAAYPTAQGTVQPVIAPAPAAQRAPSTQMHAPAAPMSMPIPSSTPAPIPVPAPVVPPAPPFGPQPTTSSARSQMPQPHLAHTYNPPPSTQMPQPHLSRSYSSGRSRSPVIPNPVIPPPPVTNSVAPDSGRLRLADFYRTPDLPPQAPRSTVNEPVRPLSAGPPGRTPFAPTMQMRTPGPVPISNNPLPPPPANVWDTSPYRQVLENLPNELPNFIDLPHRSEVLVGESEPIPRPQSRLAGLFGGKDKGKKPLRGLFRSRSNVQDMPVPNEGPSRHARSRTMTSIFIPPAVAPSMGMPEPDVPNTSMPTPSYGPPIRFDHTGEYAGFVNHSPHRVMYKNKMYPTALHLLEAMKFMHQPSLQERIRTCKDVNDMYPLSASLHEHVRSDWGQVFMKIMEDVLYLKFKQHPVLRTLLLNTGLADIIYADENLYWGEGPSGDGANELGRALCRIRERLRQDGDM